METIIRRIQENDPTLTDLDFSRLPPVDSETFSDLISALSSANAANITSVNLILRFLRKLEEQQRFHLSRVIGSLPNLYSLRFGSSGLTGLPLQLLHATLTHDSSSSEPPQRLRSLTIHSIHLKDNIFYRNNNANDTEDEDYRAFLDVLRRQLDLETFSLLDVEDSFDLDSLVDVLVTLPKLQQLTLQSYSRYNQRLTRASLAHLLTGTTTVLQSLSLHRLRLVTILPETLLSLEHNTTLQKLSLSQNGMNFECGMAVAHIFSVNRVLTEVNLAFNEIPDECGPALGSALVQNDALEILDLSGNELELYTCRRFAHLLASHHPQCALKRLILSQNDLKDEGVSMLAAGLGQNDTIQSLALAQVGITEASCRVVAAALHTNTTLRRLNLADNRIGRTGCDALAEALQPNNNTTLREINLNGNQLKDMAVAKLAEALRDNQILERLNLRNNPDLTKEAYLALERILVHNFALLHLWLPPTLDMVMPNSCISSYIQLNRLGRRQLLHRLDRSRPWLQAIQKSASDLHCLYWLTRSNPSVVEWLQQSTLWDESEDA